MAYAVHRPTGGMGDVSVVMATHNGMTRGYIFEAIESVMAQTIKPRHFIIVDDGSTDGTGREIRKRYGSQVELVEVEKGGVSRARNIGTFRVATKYVAFLDDDDLFLPEKLEKQLQACDSQPSAVMVFSAAQCIDPQGSLLHIVRSSMTGITFPESLLGNDFTLPSSVMVSVEAIRSAGAFHEALRLSEDFDFFVRISQVGTSIYLDEPLIHYRVHPRQALRVLADLEKGNLDVVAMHAQRVFGVRAKHAINFFCYGAVLRALSRGDVTLAREMFKASVRPLDMGLMARRMLGMLLQRIRPLKLRFRKYEIRAVLIKLGALNASSGKRP